MDTIDKISTATGSISIQETGIMRYEIDDTTEELTLQNVKEYLSAIQKVGEGKSYCNLVIMKHFIQCGAEARKFSASEENNIYTIADAFVTESEALRIVGNFYIRFDKPTRPTKLFNNEADALKWLRTFL